MGRRSAAARRGPRVPRSVVGALAIAVFLGLIWFGYEVANGIPGVPYHNVTAQFADVAGLRTGNGVRVDSVRVGQVSAIGYRDHHATVTMQLPPATRSTEMPRRASAPATPSASTSWSSTRDIRAAGCSRAT